MNQRRQRDDTYEAYVLRVWFSHSPPHCRLILKRIGSEQTWHFREPNELTLFLVDKSAEILTSLEQ